jgi:CubicO group peptidase (beta-lactamase class C family)
MTATLVGMMADEGKFKWTTTIGEVLGPDMPGLNPAFCHHARATSVPFERHSLGQRGDGETL